MNNSCFPESLEVIIALHDVTSHHAIVWLFHLIFFFLCSTCCFDIKEGNFFLKKLISASKSFHKEDWFTSITCHQGWILVYWLSGQIRFQVMLVVSVFQSPEYGLEHMGIPHVLSLIWKELALRLWEQIQRNHKSNLSLIWVLANYEGTFQQ